MCTVLPNEDVARERHTCMQGDVSEGTLTPVELPEEDTSNERALSGAEAGASGAALWGEDLKVRRLPVPWSLHALKVAILHRQLPRDERQFQ